MCSEIDLPGRVISGRTVSQPAIVQQDTLAADAKNVTWDTEETHLFQEICVSPYLVAILTAAFTRLRIPSPVDVDARY